MVISCSVNSFDKPLILFSNNSGSYVLLVLNLIENNKIQDAFRGLPAAYQINPSNFEVNYYLGLACYSNKEYDKADELHSKINSIINQIYS